MNFNVSIINICRVCMASQKGISLIKDPILRKKFEFTTKLTINEAENMPTMICVKCVANLKSAYDFVQSANAAEVSLKAFLAKINTEFLQYRVKKTPTDDENESETIGKEVVSVAEKPKNIHKNKECSRNKLSPRREFGKTDASTKFGSVKQEQILDKTQITQQKSTSNESHDNDIEVLNVDIEKAYDDIGDEQYVLIGVSNADLMEFVEDTDEETIIEHEPVDETFNSEMNNMEMEIAEVTDDKNETLYVAELLYTDEPHSTQTKAIEEDEAPQQKLKHQTQTETQEHKRKENHRNFLEEYKSMLAEQSDNFDQFADANSVELYCYDSDEDVCQQQNDEKIHQNEDITLQPKSSEIQKVQFHQDEIIERAESRKKFNNKKTVTKNKKRKLSKLPPAMLAGFFCIECHRDFSTKTNLTRHMQTHAGNRPYQCSECGKGFSQNGSLKQHMYIHTGEKPFVCKICDRGFTQCKSLVFHMRRHTGEKPFVCNNCGLTFRQKDGLKSHVLKHHVVSAHKGGVQTHGCVICNKIMTDKLTLREHMKTHVNNHKDIGGKDVMLHTLEDEGAEFVNNESLLNTETALHVVDGKTSSAAKPSRAKKFQCRKCFKCFAIKRNLVRHLSVHDIPLDENIKCDTCHIAFATKYALFIHQVKQHRATIELKECAICEMAFASRAEMTSHFNSAHADGDHDECPSLDIVLQKDHKEDTLEQELSEPEEYDKDTVLII